MPTLFTVVIFGLMGGIAVGLQSPLASMMSQRVGTMASVFIIHIGGAVFAGAFLLTQRASHFGEVRSLPWYVLMAGGLGVVVISAVSYAIPRVGVVTITFLIVAGQLLISALIDHFGWLGTDVRPLDPSRILGIIVLFIGVWLIVR